MANNGCRCGEHRDFHTDGVGSCSKCFCTKFRLPDQLEPKDGIAKSFTNPRSSYDIEVLTRGGFKL